ncbi:MAG: rRNA maturation RNase YbeY [Oscillospiraceae bacterium]|jgi:probable rRNA maturation factor|nr:rRNA maturation RNase YbeY [Oscillospiraceae bacterium]
MRHRILIRNTNARVTLDPRVLRAAMLAALDAEEVRVPCEVSVLITDDYRIQAVNREFRQTDAPTDVLSFPLQTFAPGAFDARDAETDMSTGRVPLGDIVLSAERVAAQAREYGQSAEREAAYLVIHSILHLLGYDHTDEAEAKSRMRAREKTILRALGYADDCDDVVHNLR